MNLKKKPNDGSEDLSPLPMSAFLEYIKGLHNRITGANKRKNKDKPADQILDYDSVSDITDLSDEGILVTSMHKLSEEEKARLTRQMAAER